MRNNPFIVLVDACLNGVTEPDVLFGTYLRPLATALYLRDLHDHPRRESEVVSTLMRWLETKHNGLVSRIGNDETRNLRGVIRHIVKNIGLAPDKVRAFWSSVRSRDRAHPDRKISLVKCMETVLDGPVTVTKENLDQVRRLVQGEEACPCSGNMEIILPGTVEARLRDHLGRAGVAPGKRTDRIVRFAERLIRDIGVTGRRRIPCDRINQLAGLGKGRRHAGRYKRLLTGAGIIEPGSDKTMRVKLKSILYQLTDWVVDEVVREVGSAPVSAPTQSDGHRRSPGRDSPPANPPAGRLCGT